MLINEKVMFWGILFIAILAYWLGCKRTKIKFLELLMTVDRRWRESVFQQQLEGELFLAKLFILYLMFCLCIVLYR
ncbi:MAG: hypothetical protein HRT37_01300 [Alteromonadaceae bacterium]|nr:hypothetical protein [Alteromonadaceae bacterium]